MRIFKNKPFTRFANKSSVGDAALCEAVQDAERGLIAADLGGGVIKQRIARPRKGEIGRISDTYRIPGGITSVLRSRVRQE
ncbi:MAG: type II toxin-antitoxin system RelE/ParE family toxin [Bryobacteraceae bacterium]